MDSATPPTPSEERTIWEGHSSQIVNLPAFILCGLAAGVLLGGAILFHSQWGPVASLALAGSALIPALTALTKWVQNRCRRYRVTTERIHFQRGVFARKTDDLELYRVKDYVLVEPFLFR